MTDRGRARLVAIIEAGPDLAEHGVVRFRLCDLCALVKQRFGVTYQEQGLSKLIKKLGFRRISARPQHPKSDPEIQAEYKKIPGSGRQCRRRQSRQLSDRSLVR